MALFADAIRLVNALRLLTVRYLDVATTEIVLLHILGILRFLSLDFPPMPLSRWVQNFVTSTGFNWIYGELYIRRSGPLDWVKSVLDLSNLVLRDVSGFLKMSIFECFCGLIFHMYYLILFKSSRPLLSADHTTDHHGCAKGYIFTQILNWIGVGSCARTLILSR